MVKVPQISFFGPKLSKKLKKIGSKVIFTCAAIFNSISSYNRLKVLSKSCPGVYKLKYGGQRVF